MTQVDMKRMAWRVKWVSNEWHGASSGYQTHGMARQVDIKRGAKTFVKWISDVVRKHDKGMSNAVRQLEIKRGASSGYQTLCEIMTQVDIKRCAKS